MRPASDPNVALLRGLAQKVRRRGSLTDDEMRLGIAAIAKLRVSYPQRMICSLITLTELKLLMSAGKQQFFEKNRAAGTDRNTVAEAASLADRGLVHPGWRRKNA